MRISIAISLLILAVAALPAWNQLSEISVLHKKRSALSAEAAALGIIVLDPEDHRGTLQFTKKQRRDGDADMRQEAQDFIAFAKEMQKWKEGSVQPDNEAKERMFAFIERLQTLSASELRILIEEFRAADDLDDDIRRVLLSFSVMTLAKDHPEAALRLLSESGDLIDGKSEGRHVVSSALAKWAERDPMAALEWVRENSAKNPGLITDEVKAELVAGAARTDMKAALALIGDLDFGNPSDGISSIAEAIGSPSDRTEFISLLRGYDKENPDQRSIQRAMLALTKGVMEEGFESGSKWLASSGLSPDELATFAVNIRNSAKNGEQGQWISWMGENLPAESRDKQVSETMRQWTQKDYRAAGEWLAAAPAGPAKNASVLGYVDAVSKYDPQTATQWAMTLPAEDRDQSMQAIYRNMPQETPADRQAREAFKTQHGIE
ncbi:hypothetical protein HZ994_09180 [Akkermansiaceae bacterium]|nr:hypothetical protein HZ994_09180 [Akkermansiaceae bacterium]